MSDGSAIIEQQFALAEKVLDGRTHLDFAENHACLTGLFDSFREFKDQELVIYEHDRLTYGEVAAQAAHFARTLTKEHSIIAGDRIGIVLPNKPEWIISFVAVAALGAVPVLINARAAEDELDYCLSSVNCRACITERNTGLDIIKIHPGECRSTAAGDTALKLVERDPSDEAILMFTSGTTGKPKAAVLSHQGLMSAMKTIHYSSALIAIQMAEKYGVDYETLVQMRPPPVTLLVFPLFHVSGCHAVFLSNLMQGGKIVLMSRWQPEQALELIAAEKVTGLPGVPTMHWDM
ncbi:MAG: acyl--CoA ligase, partial [Gammaproteobacteria bacterium]|nr:acyl--CoA ligase [Gammaproteobacteria bacterium]